MKIISQVLSGVVIFAMLTLPACNSCHNETTNQENETVTPTVKEKPMNTGTENTVVVVETSMGNFEIELSGDKAPISVQNFLTYVNSGFYNGTIFHRVIKGFMIQGGGFTPDMNEKNTSAPIKNEAKNGLLNKRYSIAMARTQIVDSATSQFFINTEDNAFLNYQGDANYGYAVFGQVISGTDVIDRISAVATTTEGMYQDVPETDVVINKISLK